jgi:hypothetical protein
MIRDTAPLVRKGDKIYPETGWLREFLNRKYGCKTQGTPAVINIGAAPPPNPAQLAPSDWDRLEVVLCNVGAANVFYTFLNQPPPALGIGIILPANGGIQAWNAEEDGEIVAYEIWGWTAGPPNAVFMEYLRGIGR